MVNTYIVTVTIYRTALGTLTILSPAARQMSCKSVKSGHSLAIGLPSRPARPTSHHNRPETRHDRFPYPLDLARSGHDAVIEPGMTPCIESNVGPLEGAEGVKLEEQVLVTESGVERLSSFPFEADLLACGWRTG